VARLREWPSGHCVRTLLDSEALSGYWFNRSQEHAARVRREKHDRLKYGTQETVTPSPLPCWKDLTPEAYRQHVANLVAQIEEAADAKRKRTGIEPLGAKAIQAQHPHTRAERVKKSPAPRVHAVRREVRRRLCEAYSWFPLGTPKSSGEAQGRRPAPHFRSAASRRPCRTSTGRRAEGVRRSREPLAGRARKARGVSARTLRWRFHERNVANRAA
jgi:hypothetical protein